MLNEKLLRAVIIAIVGGILLIGFTYLFEFLLPLLGVAAVIVIAYLVYRWKTTGNIQF